MENNLRNRYIYAVVRHLPIRMQTEVEMELSSLISEMADERKGNKTTPSEQDIKDVLTELGSPEELALKYYGSERKSLISGIYFLMYKRVLCIVLPVVAAVLAVLTIIGFVIGDESSLHIVIGVVNMSFMAQAMQVIIVPIGGVVQAFTVITVVFAILEHMKVDIKFGDLHNLPEIPEQRLKISPIGPIFGIALSVSLTALFLGFPQVMGISINFNWVPAFDIGVIRGLWLPILLWSIVEIVAEIVKLIEGRYTLRLAMVTVVTSVLQVVCAFIIFRSNNIVNPEFLNFVSSLDIDFQAIEWIIDYVAMQPNLMLLVLMLIIIFFETLDVVVKVFQSRRT